MNKILSAAIVTLSIAGVSLIGSSTAYAIKCCACTNPGVDSSQIARYNPQGKLLCKLDVSCCPVQCPPEGCPGPIG